MAVAELLRPAVGVVVDVMAVTEVRADAGVVALVSIGAMVLVGVDAGAVGTWGGGGARRSGKRT